MKPSIRKIIKYDYLSTLLFIIAVVSTLLLIAIILSGIAGVFRIIIPIILVSYTLLFLRVFLTRNVITKLQYSRVNGVIHKFDQNNGNFYIVVNYEVNTRDLGKRIPILAGPVLRAKLRKLKEVELLINPQKPKKIFIAEFYYD